MQTKTIIVGLFCAAPLTILSKPKAPTDQGTYAEERAAYGPRKMGGNKGEIVEHWAFYQLSFEQLEEELSKLLFEGSSFKIRRNRRIPRAVPADTRLAARYLERMLVLCKNIARSRELLIQLADIWYSLEEYHKAYRKYSRYQELYPGSDRTPYAQYRSFLCLRELLPTPEHDQSKTRELLRITDDYLKQENTEYRQEVQEIYNSCIALLCAHEQHVIEHYVNRMAYSAARKRVNYIVRELLPKYGQLAAKIAEINDFIDCSEEAENRPSRKLIRRVLVF